MHVVTDSSAGLVLGRAVVLQDSVYCRTVVPKAHACSPGNVFSLTLPLQVA